MVVFNEFYLVAAERSEAALGIYALDFITESMFLGETKTTVIDYLRQSRDFASWNVDHFYEMMLNDLVDLVDWIPESIDETQVVEKVWCLCKRHGNQAFRAVKRMIEIHDNLYQPIKENSLLGLISEREYLKEPVERLVASIREKVSEAIPAMFRQNPPKNEPDLNTKIQALLNTHRQDLKSEHPEVSFAGAGVISDHRIGTDLIIESKYIRASTTPSVATDGVAADLTKYPPNSHILFVVYDPTHRIADDRRFTNEIEAKGRCTVCILR